jgi:AraC-like DNA-binding protein
VTRYPVEGKDSITEISLSVGYANPSHFARLYRRTYGEPPHATRRRSEMS